MSVEDPLNKEMNTRILDKHLFDKNANAMSKAINNINNAKWVGKIRSRHDPMNDANQHTRQSMSSNIYSLQGSSKDNLSIV